MVRKQCPKCAEHVRSAALICRYCGHEFLSSDFDEVSPKRAPKRIWAALIASVAVAFAGHYFLAAQREGPPDGEQSVSAPKEAPTAIPVRAFQSLNVGETLEWQAENGQSETIRQAGPFVLRITRRNDGELSAPSVKLSFGEQAIEMTGEFASTTYSHKVSAVPNKMGDAPLEMLQSFTGGAHCCNHVQVAGKWNGKLKAVDLGTFDGDYIEVPKDISGDGLPDFKVFDNNFLYAFASYASSYAPSRILNLISGKVVDVSTSTTFNKSYLEEMKRAGQACSAGETGDERNGACPAFLANAARLGSLNSAWRIMVESYDASSDRDFPTGCAVDSEPCPASQKIVYKSYPEALLAFLKRLKYVHKDWFPPDFVPPGNSDDGDSEDDTATT